MMASLRFVLVLVWLLFGAALAFGAPAGRELHVFQMATPDDAPCDGQERYAFWANTTGAPIYVVGWRVTPLVSQRALADVRWGITHYWGSEAADQKGIDSGSWDHYAEPTQDQSINVWSSPHYRTIWPGQGIAIYTRCAPMANSPAAQSGLVVLIRFTTEQP